MSGYHSRPLYSILVLMCAVLACSLPGPATTQPLVPAATQPPILVATQVDATKVALEILATQNAPAAPQLVDATKIALEILATNNAPATVQPLDATKVALEVQATNASAQLTRQADQSQSVVLPSSTPQQAMPTPDVKLRMKNAKILVYEDTQEIGLGSAKR